MSIREAAVAVTAIALFAGSPAVPTTEAQQQGPSLPEEVTEWLARDQLRRWAGMLETGEELFSEGSCAKCHGQGGNEGRFGPDLTDDLWVHSDGSLEGIRWTILWGVRKEDLADPDRPFMLPAGGMDLEFDELAALAAYVWSLGNGTHLPERR